MMPGMMTRSQAIKLVASTLAFADPPLVSTKVLERCLVAGALVVDALAAANALDVVDDRVTDVPLSNGDGAAVFAGEAS